MIYLLDTNACIQVLRGRHQRLLQRFGSHPLADLCVCSVVCAELLYGTFRSTRPATNRANVNAFLQPFASLPFNDAAAAVYADLRYQLEVQGTPIASRICKSPPSLLSTI